MFTQKGDRVAIFIDGDNLYGTLNNLGWQVDFTKLRELLAADCYVYNAFYYTSWEEDTRKRSFAIFLLNNGFTVRRREQQRIQKAGREVNVKGDTDILMVMDLLTTKKNWDMAVLVTGDGDFVPVVEYLRLHGKRIVAVSSKFESASIDLVNAVDRFIDLAEIRQFVERAPGAAPAAVEKPTTNVADTEAEEEEEEEEEDEEE